ncbi:hypothetical protein GGI11_000391 [Coemansia sp. RSA 2049]|nr:hypothetical protein GGI11_000391 [Coemansia sp. RSA 2049]KAJ2590681.1 hypothetical protein EV177_009024 [Coemansia sp. RSA 1804]
MVSKSLPAEVGREHWLAQNRRWRQGQSPLNCRAQSPVVQDGKKKDRKPLSKRMYDHTFRKLVMEWQPLKQSLPLEEAIPMIVYGWKKTGVWPSDPPTPI